MKEPNTFWTDQFNNADALDGYAGIGRELAEQVDRIDAFVGAVGSAGMLTGVSRALKAAGSQRPHHRARAGHVAAATTGKGGAHRVEGTAPGFWPPHLTKGVYDEARAIDEERRTRDLAPRG